MGNVNEGKQPSGPSSSYPQGGPGNETDQKGGGTGGEAQGSQQKGQNDSGQGGQGQGGKRA